MIDERKDGGLKAMLMTMMMRVKGRAMSVAVVQLYGDVYV
jgi:hypothetical protein